MKKFKKLKLNIETVKIIGGDQLRNANGGYTGPACTFGGCGISDTGECGMQTRCICTWGTCKNGTCGCNATANCPSVGGC